MRVLAVVGVVLGGTLSAAVLLVVSVVDDGLAAARVAAAPAAVGRVRHGAVRVLVVAGGGELERLPVRAEVLDLPYRLCCCCNLSREGECQDGFLGSYLKTSDFRNMCCFRIIHERRCV